MSQLQSNNTPLHLESTHRDYKARNVLTLEDRVSVIRDYKRDPVYQHLAEKYNCSPKQIKNIIANSEAVLLYYNNRKADGSNSEERRQRQQKIAFLGKVIYEFIQRVVYHGVQINASIVRRKALQVKESIAIMNFYPNNAWLQNFKTQYKIPEFDLMTLRQSMFLREPKEESIKAVDLIQFVSRCEKENAEKRKDIRTDRIGVDDQYTAQHKSTYNEPTVAYENNDFDYMDSNEENRSMVVSLDSDDDDDNDYIEPRRKQAKKSAYAESSQSKRTPSPLPDIDSFQRAQLYLKALEDYALLGDNFRAIGLIEQLEQALKQPPKGEDFQA